MVRTSETTAALLKAVSSKSRNAQVRLRKKMKKVFKLLLMKVHGLSEEEAEAVLAAVKAGDIVFENGQMRQVEQDIINSTAANDAALVNLDAMIGSGLEQSEAEQAASLQSALATMTAAEGTLSRTQLGRANAAAQEKANLMKGVNEDEKKIAQSIERVAMSQAMAAQKIAKRAEKASEEAEKETATSGDLRTQVTQISERVDHIGEKLEKYNEIVGKQTEREGAIKDLKESGDNSVATVCVASFFTLAAEGSGVGHTPRNLEL